MKVCMPWSNLGCLGLRVGRFYGDVSRSGIFLTDGRGRWSLNVRGLHAWK